MVKIVAVWPAQSRISPDTSLTERQPTGEDVGSCRMNRRRLRSQRETVRSLLEVTRAEKLRERAMATTGVTWLKSVERWISSTVLAVHLTAQTETVPSVPAVISVLASANLAHES